MEHRRQIERRLDAFWQRPNRTLFAIWLAATLLMGMIGPFGTFPELSFGERLIYWGSVIGLAIGLGIILRAMVISIVGRDRHPLVIDTVSVPFFVVLYTPPLHRITRMTAMGTEPFSQTQMGLIVLGVTLMLIVLREVFHLHSPGVKGRYADLGNGSEAPTGASHHASGGPSGALDAAEMPASPLVERLPEEVRGAILSVSGSNHYVEVRTDKGQASVLLRFSDALRELDAVPGLQVHRSHWVADAAVDSVRRDGHRTFVVLTTGEELPVSRTYARDAFERWG